MATKKKVAKKAKGKAKKVAKKKAAPKPKATPKPKRGEGKPYFRGKGGNPRQHEDMITIALRGPEATEVMQYMEKHHLNGAQLLREGYALHKEARS